MAVARPRGSQALHATLHDMALAGVTWSPTRQGRARQAQARQGRAGQGSTGKGREGQGMTGQGRNTDLE